MYSFGMRNLKEVFVIMPNNKTNDQSKSGQSGSQGGSQSGMQGGGFNDPQTGKQGTGQSGPESGVNEPQHKGQFDKTGSSGGQFGSQKEESDR